MGEYLRQGYGNTAEDWMEQAAADFNQVIAYLTGLYGEPDLPQTPGETNMIAWSNVAGQPKAGTIGPIVYTFDNGDVHVVFTAAPEYQN